MPVIHQIASAPNLSRMMPQMAKSEELPFNAFWNSVANSRRLHRLRVKRKSVQRRGHSDRSSEAGSLTRLGLSNFSKLALKQIAGGVDRPRSVPFV